MSSSLGNLFGSPHVKKIGPPSEAELTQQAVAEAGRQNAGLLQAIAQQQRFGFRNQLSTAHGVGPRLGGDE